MVCHCCKRNMVKYKGNTMWFYNNIGHKVTIFQCFHCNAWFIVMKDANGRVMKDASEYLNKEVITK